MFIYLFVYVRFNCSFVFRIHTVLYFYFIVQYKLRQFYSVDILEMVIPLAVYEAWRASVVRPDFDGGRNNVADVATNRLEFLLCLPNNLYM